MRRPIDLILLGGALVPLAMWAAFWIAGAPAAVWLLLLFQVGLNLPHYFQTYTLTYFDPEVRAREAGRLVPALAIALALPFGAILLGPGALAATLAVLVLWGLLHITQQTRGLCGLYLRRGVIAARTASSPLEPAAPARDQLRTAPAAEAGRFRQALLLGLFAGSAACVAFRMAAFGLAMNDRHQALPALFPPATAIAIVAAAAFAFCLIGALTRPGRGAALALGAAHVAIFALAITVEDLNLVLVLATSWHALQYLALSLTVQRGLDSDALFPRLARAEVVAFFGVALLFGLAAAGLGAALPKPWGQAVYLPLLLLHYLTDGWLWRPDKNPSAKAWLAPLAA